MSGIDNNRVRYDDDEDEDKEKSPPVSPMVDKNLYKSRIVMITGQISQDLARDVCARLHALSYDNDEPITVIVSSPGGHVESGDMIHDTIKFIKPRVRVLGTGWVASAGALIYVAADRKDRYSLPNTRFLLHQPSGASGGKASDIEIQLREFQKMKDRLNKIFVTATGQTLEKIEKDTDRDFWLTAEEAVDYGLVGQIIERSDQIK